MGPLAGATLVIGGLARLFLWHTAPLLGVASVVMGGGLFVQQVLANRRRAERADKFNDMLDKF